MHPEATTRPQVEMRSYRFLWVNMMLTREPTWLVCPDRKEREIDAWEPAADLGEVRAVAGGSPAKSTTAPRHSMTNPPHRQRFRS